MKPLAVDLDGTLIKSDLLFESIILLFKNDPLAFLASPSWLLRGKAHFKREIAKRSSVHATSLPYNQPFIDFLRQEKGTGRRLILISASDALLVEAIASHLGLFDTVIASDGKINMKGEEKRKVLVAQFGEKGFDYAANDPADLAIWKSSGQAILVNAAPSLVKKAQAVAPVQRVFSDHPVRMKTYFEAIRVHHWVKNVLIFLPVIMAHQIFSPRPFANAVLAFIAFSLCASSIYIINDLLDLEADRQHPKKKYRPFACSKLPIQLGMLLIPLMLGVSIGLSFLLPMSFMIILVFYILITSLYSLVLKRIVILDVICLALLYALRIFAGSVVTGTPISKWLLVFALFFFASLAFNKRFSELYQAQHYQNAQPKGRNYLKSDLECLGSLGTSCGTVSVMVLALYISSSDVTLLYKRSEFLWMICPILLAWMSRLWLYTYRGLFRDDPIVFAIKDKVSYLTGIIIAIIYVLAI